MGYSRFPEEDEARGTEENGYGQLEDDDDDEEEEVEGTEENGYGQLEDEEEGEEEVEVKAEDHYRRRRSVCGDF